MARVEDVKFVFLGKRLHMLAHLRIDRRSGGLAAKQENSVKRPPSSKALANPFASASAYLTV
jgi:hypothetical protein